MAGTSQTDMVKDAQRAKALLPTIERAKAQAASSSSGESVQDCILADFLEKVQPTVKDAPPQVEGKEVRRECWKDCGMPFFEHQRLTSSVAAKAGVAAVVASAVVLEPSSPESEEVILLCRRR